MTGVQTCALPIYPAVDGHLDHLGAAGAQRRDQVGQRVAVQLHRDAPAIQRPGGEQVLELLDAGAHVIALDDLYGGTRRLFERVRRRSANLEFSYCPMHSEAELAAAKNIDPQQYEHLQGLVRYSGVQLALKRRKR